MLNLAYGWGFRNEQLGLNGKNVVKGRFFVVELMPQSIDKNRQQHGGQGIVKSVRNNKRNQGFIFSLEIKYA